MRPAAPPARPVRLPPHIVLDVDTDLAAYLQGELARHWPQARVRRVSAGLAAVADLVVVDREPARPVTRPTLWLAEIDGSQALQQLQPGLWRTPMPTTARSLKRTIQACLDHLPGRGE